MFLFNLLELRLFFSVLFSCSCYLNTNNTDNTSNDTNTTNTTNTDNTTNTISISISFTQ